MKVASRILVIVAVLLSNIMCATVAWGYRDILCGMQHMCCSAPPSVAFLYAIPFLVLIAVCLIAAVVLHRKAKNQ